MNYCKIFVIASYLYQSGGTESEHQLVGWLNDRGLNAYIYYVDNKDVIQVPEKFSKYNVRITDSIDDDINNLLIVPETLTQFMYQYKCIKKGIWWLSLNYYLYNIPTEHARLFVSKYHLPKMLVTVLKFLFKRPKDRIFEFGTDKNEILHFYNCEYVRLFLESKGIDFNNMYYLCGPIRDEYFIRGKNYREDIKENIILYNPKKGMHFTKKIIKYAKKMNCSFEFCPIENMLPDQIVDIMERSKVYIDFGDFPGPERIPREAVTMYCNILTANVGSCCNDIDVPIPRQYKFNRGKKYIKDIYKEIVNQINDYDMHVHEFDRYREKVELQRTEMNDTLDKVFG